MPKEKSVEKAKKEVKIEKVAVKKQDSKDDNVMRRRENKAPDLERRKREALSRMERRTRTAKWQKRERKEEEGLDVRIVSVRRVAKVKAGGKRLKLSVMVVVGDKGGKIGVGVAKGRDVRDASAKAVNKAKKHMVKVPLKGQTIPHEITQKFCSAKVFLKPAAPGTGVIAGGAVRAVVEAAGIKDILSKELGSKNTISNVYATYEALKNLRLSRFE